MTNIQEAGVGVLVINWSNQERKSGDSAFVPRTSDTDNLVERGIAPDGRGSIQKN